MEIDLAASTAVIIGATGSIGSACLRLIAARVKHVILVAPNATRLAAFHETIKDELKASSEWTTDLRAAISRGDLVLSAASSTRELFAPEDLRLGAVVCELSLPHTIGERVVQQRPDVLVVEGGHLRMPGHPRWDRIREPGRAFELGLAPGDALACMSETMVLALEGRFESFTLGRGIQLEKVREIAAMAQRCGFDFSEMRAFDQPITAADLAAKRDAVARARAIA
jgi:predicted amino acid dehydrogenase